MKVLVVGSGGREHALCWKLAASEEVDEVLCLPGNAGIAQVARCVEGGAFEVARSEEVGLVVIGPEADLAAGLVDELSAAGIPAFGPSAAAAQLEASKSFAKEVMAEAGVPTAAATAHRELGSALEAVRARHGRCVVKADGLAAGKGVTVCRDLETAERALRQCLEEESFGDAGATVVVEELLEGEELSVLALCSGTALVPMVAAQDHKAAFDGDRGPNTGGMGAYAPAPLGDDELLERVRTQVLEPTARAMAARNTPLSGVLYAGLMICNGEPKVLEFNVRFGDPETQPLLALLASDLFPLLVACARGELTGQEQLQWHPGATVCVVLASEGYPGASAKGRPITGLDVAVEMDDLVVFHAGTARRDDEVVTAGGRVLGVTARGDGVAAARRRAYEAVEAIHFEGMHFRRDIANRALTRRES